MSKKQIIYLVLEGDYYSSNYSVRGAASTKAAAAKLCRADQYRWERDQQLFCCDAVRRWRRVVRIRLGVCEYPEDVSFGRRKVTA